MTTFRLFVPSENIRNNRVTVEGSDVHYIQNVLRLKEKSALEILDDQQRIYAVEITKMDKDRVHCAIVGVRNIKSEPSVKITIAQGIPKGNKLDQVIRQGTELGMHALMPMITERSIPRFSSDKGQEKQTRWQRIAKEAAEQSGRLIVPNIHAPTSYSSVLETTKSYAARIFLSETEDQLTLKKCLRNVMSPDSILIIIGPEGGFTAREQNDAESAGCQKVTLGRRILRTETAPIAALAMIFYELGL